MSNVLNQTRSAARSLVDREWRRTRSKMVAYESVAKSLGCSSEWLRKYVSHHGAKDPGLMTGFKILEVYSRVCERVERAADSEKQLKRDIDALVERIGCLAGSDNETESG